VTEHVYPGAVRPDGELPTGTIDLGVAPQPCQYCGADHVHALLLRSRMTDGSPSTLSRAGCCACERTWWNDPYAEDSVRPVPTSVAAA
jgi:hypothetical protein